jgi:ABC-type multidrug transport system ATPase subunit
MQITLENIGKKFGREWIFRGINHVFESGKPTVIRGSNGSGKSTLLQIISGSMQAGEGSLKYQLHNTAIPTEEIYRQVSIASPYLELMDDFTLRESISFHGKFKNWRNKYTEKDLLELSGLAHAADKQLKHYSSGMKMRVRLLLAILSDASLLLLDEPCSNLDQAACTWYADLIRMHTSNRTVIVCSNEVKEEFFFCTQELELMKYKAK